jgi:hypothetical protein
MPGAKVRCETGARRGARKTNQASVRERLHRNAAQLTDRCSCLTLACTEMGKLVCAARPLDPDITMSVRNGIIRRGAHKAKAMVADVASYLRWNSPGKDRF